MNFPKFSRTFLGFLFDSVEVQSLNSLIDTVPEWLIPQLVHPSYARWLILNLIFQISFIDVSKFQTRIRIFQSVSHRTYITSVKKSYFVFLDVGLLWVFSRMKNNAGRVCARKSPTWKMPHRYVVLKTKRHRLWSTFNL